MASGSDRAQAAQSDQAHSADSPSRNPPSRNPWVEALQTVGLSLVLAFGIRTFVAEARYIPSGSMLPTLEINDRLVIDKISYGFKDPHRGDIVVFRPPAAAGEQASHEAFIKRVIGLPSEIVEVKSGRVYVNGIALSENYLAATPDYEWGPEIVPQDAYLVLGDNRNDSYDGHYWGFVPRDRIIGRATVRFWPFNRLAYLADPAYSAEQ
jgi:signal peptidase I